MLIMLLPPTNLPICISIMALLFGTGVGQGQSPYSFPIAVEYSARNRTTSFDQKQFCNNIHTVLSKLIQQATKQFYGRSSGGTGNSTVYGEFQCRGDLLLMDCSRCVKYIAISEILKNSKCEDGITVQLESCYLRYQAYPSFSYDFSVQYQKCNPTQSGSSIFERNVESSIANVITEAVQTGGYASSYTNVGVFLDRAYVLVQCTKSLSPVECGKCLSMLKDFRQVCPEGSKGGELFSYGCFLRYENYLFFTPSLTGEGTDFIPVDTGLRKGLKPAVALLVTVMINSILLIIAIFIYARRQHYAQRGNKFQYMFAMFTLKELKDATRNFHLDNKLGDGGFGSVYKGTLADGQVVAIKRLSVDSRQEKSALLKELNMLTALQHWNLVRILGCCVEEPETFLVYEYMLNKSLDKILFGSEENSLVLDWKVRRGIIMGIARGLTYLHEDSQVSIIHTHIKASNILLDKQLNPKISDFGLAKLFPQDHTHVATKISGTLGYLAPEYALNGQLTEKADIFNFGLVVLEIVSGRRNTDLHQPPEKHHLLDWVCTSNYGMGDEGDNSFL
eukprot:c22346_g1_i3 orf=973-2658(-)